MKKPLILTSVMLGRLWILGAISCCLGCRALPGRMPDGYMVSLVQLIATPERFNGKPVIVTGYWMPRFEDRAIYLTREDAVHLNVSSSVAVGELAPTANSSRITEARDGYVLVEGVFRYSARGMGHMGLCPGIIEDVRAFSNAFKRDDVEGPYFTR